MKDDASKLGVAPQGTEAAAQRSGQSESSVATLFRTPVEWRFPEIGLPPSHTFLIFLNNIFHYKHLFWGTSIYGNPQMGIGTSLQLFTFCKI